MAGERRDRRRNAVRDRRRTQQFIELLTQSYDDIEEVKQQRPPETAVTKVVTVTDDALGLDDTVDVTVKTSYTLSYSDEAEGYGNSEYRDSY